MVPLRWLDREHCVKFFEKTKKNGENEEENGMNEKREVINWLSIAIPYIFLSTLKANIF